MKSLIMLVVFSLSLTGCAHRELKAPCAAIASLDEIPCGERQSVIGFAYVAADDG